jgi:quercetin dioxygenase-like cupin family protein
MAVTHIRSDDMPDDRSAIEGGTFTATVGRFSPVSDDPGAWHHHGDHHIVAYLISGDVRIESGPGGLTVTQPGPGDLVHIEPRTVHRERYAGDVAIVGFSVGAGVGRIDVDGPDPEGDAGHEGSPVRR